MNDDIRIDEDKLQAILMEMILLEKQNNRKEESNDVQMVDKLLGVLESQL